MHFHSIVLNQTPVHSTSWKLILSKNGGNLKLSDLKMTEI